MALVDPIDISSSDSDDSDLKEIDNYRDDSPVNDTASSIVTVTPQSGASSSRPLSIGHSGFAGEDPSSSSNSRILPPWATQPHRPNLTDRSSSKRKIVHDEIPSRLHKRLNSAETAGSSSSFLDNNIQQNVGSNNYDRLVTSHGMHSSHQPMKVSSASSQPSSSNVQLAGAINEIIRQKVGSSSHEVHSSQSTKRALPLSLMPPTYPRSHHLIENVGASEIRETYGKSARLYPNGSKPLPFPGKHSSTTPFVGSNDFFSQTGVGEERPAGTDESLVLQAAMQDPNPSKREATLPDGILSVSLLRHQRIALAWMLSKESSNLCSGGILADDQGLGKTISMIALIQMQKALEAVSKTKESCTTRAGAFNLDDDDGVSECVALDDANQIKGSDDFTMLPQVRSIIKRFQSRWPTAGTLIVCPASVIGQWARELDDKVTDKAKLSVLIYHGGNRIKDPAALAKYDVVLTTYAIVANELNYGEQYGVCSSFSSERKRKKSPFNMTDMTDLDSSSHTLSRVKWSRVVLDECQIIKDHRTEVARACTSLRALRRWCLSGTPLQDSLDELFSYFRFLRYDPYDRYKIFSSYLMDYISRDSHKGYAKLQAVLKNTMLRRTKGTLIDGRPIADIPPKKVNLKRVEFDLEERAFYEKLECDSFKQFKAYVAAGTVNRNYANILLILLRLRQACDHPLLVKGLSSDPPGKTSSEIAKMLPRGLLLNLLKRLETSPAICPACNDPPENAVVTMCRNVFCHECVSDHLTGEDNACPAAECEEQLVFSRSTLRRLLCVNGDGDEPDAYELGEESIVLQSNYVSSKIKSALEILESHCTSKRQRSEDGDASSSLHFESPEKAIVFSQWTNMLDLVEMSLKNSTISYRRFDGTMSSAARDKAVEDFNTDPEVDVMLMSLKAEYLGLNMVAACHVILLDPCWSPTVEDQAADRAHRIGQTRTVTVSRLTVKDTIEDRILALQDDKRKMVALAFGEDPSFAHPTKLSMEDLRLLFDGPARC